MSRTSADVGESRRTPLDTFVDNLCETQPNSGHARTRRRRGLDLQTDRRPLVRYLSLPQGGRRYLRQERRRPAQARRRQSRCGCFLGPEWNVAGLVFPSSLGKRQDGSHLLYGLHLCSSVWGCPSSGFMTSGTPRPLYFWAGHPSQIVSEMLGHSTIAITLDLYSHVTPTTQRDAMNTLLVVRSCLPRHRTTLGKGRAAGGGGVLL